MALADLFLLQSDVKLEYIDGALPFLSLLSNKCKTKIGGVRDFKTRKIRLQQPIFAARAQMLRDEAVKASNGR